MRVLVCESKSFAYMCVLVKEGEAGMKGCNGVGEHRKGESSNISKKTKTRTKTAAVVYAK
jgi:hypothetical protein